MPDFPRDLPTLKFGDDFFYIDSRLHQFRQKDAPFNLIPFDDLTEIVDGSSMLCYDTKAKNIYPYYDDKIPLPEQVIILRLPPHQFLDPVGLALWGKLNEDTFLRKGNNFFPKAVTLSDKKVRKLYAIKEPITRTVPQFGIYDTALKEEKFKSKKR